MKTSQQPLHPWLIIIMGVSGCGKSTVAQELAHSLGWEYLDADDFHSEQAKRLMSQGIALTDEQRSPWITRILQHLSEEPRQHRVLAYSGLRRAHRQRFRQLAYHIRFVCLETDRETLCQRLNQRQGHFVGQSLIESQLASLERFFNENDAISISSRSSPILLANKIKSLLQLDA